MEAAKKEVGKPYIFKSPNLQRDLMDESKLRKILDSEEPIDMKESAILAAVKEGPKIVPVLASYLPNFNPRLKSATSNALAMIGGREVYKHLLNLVQDPDVYVDALSDFGTTRDSRALFVLANLYNGLNHMGKRAVLYAFDKLADPRAVDFLTNIAHTADNSDLRTLAQKAAEESKRNTYFTYTFVWDEEMRQRAKQKEGRILVANKADLQNKEVIEILRDFEADHRPQTYVVTLDEKFFIGGNVQEHVEVAKGQDVIAAGEVEFDLDSLDIKYINNRSNGYYPGATSFRWVRESLADSGIKVPSEFSEIFPRDGFTCDDILRMFPLYKSARL